MTYEGGLRMSVRNSVNGAGCEGGIDRKRCGVGMLINVGYRINHCGYCRCYLIMK